MIQLKIFLRKLYRPYTLKKEIGSKRTQLSVFSPYSISQTIKPYGIHKGRRLIVS